MAASAARIFGVALASVAALAIAFAAITRLALESGGVAIVETHAGDGSIRSTHVWFVEPERELWIEAGSAQNPWFDDLGRDRAPGGQLATSHSGQARRAVASVIDQQVPSRDAVGDA